jgi:extracellular factor (EF) 3-hydroxypalmitic acid methyl ester biosynthesis protein
VRPLTPNILNRRPLLRFIRSDEATIPPRHFNEDLSTPLGLSMPDALLTSSLVEPRIRKSADRVLEAARDPSASFAPPMRAYLALLRDELMGRGPENFRPVAQAALGHPIRGLFHADPFTWRTYDKPRGYAGDAVMLDYIYGPQFAPIPELDPTIQRIFMYTTNSHACQAVRYRREQLAMAIDAACNAKPCSRIYAMACGHLRELASSRAVALRRPMELIAMDQDPESLAGVQRNYGALGVELVHAGVRDVLKGSFTPIDADLIYAAGLLDYLPGPVARAFLKTCFDGLHSGGRLLYANFLPDVEDVGYMATYMDWHLLCRTPGQARDLAGDIQLPSIAQEEIWCDPTQNIVFVSLTKQ